MFRHCPLIAFQLCIRPALVVNFVLAGTGWQGTAQVSSGEKLGRVRLCLEMARPCSTMAHLDHGASLLSKEAQMDHALGQLGHKERPTCFVYHILPPLASPHSDDTFYRMQTHNCCQSHIGGKLFSIRSAVLEPGSRLCKYVHSQPLYSLLYYVFYHCIAHCIALHAHDSLRSYLTVTQD
jgi:hypothetical protein